MKGMIEWYFVGTHRSAVPGFIVQIIGAIPMMMLTFSHNSAISSPIAWAAVQDLGQFLLF